MWTLDSAIPLIRRISPIAQRHGFSVALYGSVLDAGKSEKDLDLFFVEQDVCNVQGCLDEIGTLPEIRSTGKAFQCGGGACAVIRMRDGTVIDAQFKSVGSIYESCAPV